MATKKTTSETTVEENTVTINVSSLDLLKQQADLHGLTYDENITENALKKLVANALSADVAGNANEDILALEREAMKLVCVNITAIDPSKANWKGEYFSTGNDILGTVSYFVPFNTDWLIPQILVNCIKEKVFQRIQSTENQLGVGVLSATYVPAYNVQILPLPTPEQIEELKRQQLSQGV